MKVDRYNAIMQAAERLFADKGYARVSTAEIAEAAGVSKGLVHHHFTSKQELLRQILEAVRVPMAEKLRTVVRNNETAHGRLRGIIETVVDAAYSRPQALQIILFEALSTEDTKGPLLALRQVNRDMYARLVRDGIDKGEFRCVDERVGALFIGGIVREAVSQISLGQMTGRRDTIADDVVQLICRGIDS